MTVGTDVIILSVHFKLDESARNKTKAMSTSAVLHKTPSQYCQGNRWTVEAGAEGGTQAQRAGATAGRLKFCGYEEHTTCLCLQPRVARVTG